MSAPRLISDGVVLERLEDWLRADLPARQDALPHCLERIRRLDPFVRAWVDVRPQPATGAGPLAGIPVGIKDVIETRGLATEYGSPIYKGRRGEVDAAIVERLQSLGAIVIGKTEAAAFAYRTPPPTRNPRNPDHTPGGSSSGSAAAVAAGMVPVTVGTQTLGSVLRPASFCGVVGFKPTYGALSTVGVLPVSHTLDTLGFFTHTPEGMLLLWEALGQGGPSEEAAALGAVDPLPDVDSEMGRAFRETVSALRRRGVVIEPVPIAPMLRLVDEEARVVMAYECAGHHEQRYREHGRRLLDLADLIEQGLRTPDDRYRSALAAIAESKHQIAEQFRKTPVILSPAAPGPAPRGLSSTGDARMNSPWTALGTPAIAIPLPVGNALPLGLQLTAAHDQDGCVLRTAIRVATLIASADHS